MVSEQAAFLFIYGTLHPDRAPFSIAATAKLLKPVGRATILGRLYDLQEYPGVILSGDLAEIVAGEVFLLPEFPEAAEILARLDADQPRGLAKSLTVEWYLRCAATDEHHSLAALIGVQGVGYYSYDVSWPLGNPPWRPGNPPPFLAASSSCSSCSYKRSSSSRSSTTVR